MTSKRRAVPHPTQPATVPLTIHLRPDHAAFLATAGDVDALLAHLIAVEIANRAYVKWASQFPWPWGPWVWRPGEGPAVGTEE